MSDGRIELEVELKAINLDSFSDKIAASVSGKLGKGKASDKMSDGVRKGTREGVVQGGLMLGVLGVIANTLKDIPIVVAVMKLFKVVLMLLLLPLIPILKPVLQGMAAFAKDFMSKWRSLTPQQQATAGGAEAIAFGASYAATGNLGIAGAVGVSAGLGAVNLSVISNHLIAAGDASEKMGQKAEVAAVNLDKFGGIMTTGATVVDGIVKGVLTAFGVKLDDGKTKQDKFSSSVSDSTTALDAFWKTLTQNKNGRLAVGSDLSGFSGASQAAATAVANVAISQVNSALGVAAQFIAAVSGKDTSLPLLPGIHDGIITPNGLVSTHPDDYIIATKNPGSLGGGKGGTYNFTINNPQINNTSDMKKLLQQLSIEMNKQNARYNSYV